MNYAAIRSYKRRVNQMQYVYLIAMEQTGNRDLTSWHIGYKILNSALWESPGADCSLIYPRATKLK